MDASSVALGILATAIPFYLALTLSQLQSLKRHSQLALAFAAGTSIYFLLDGYVDSAELGVPLGYYGGWQPLELLAAFALTFLILQSFRRRPGYAWPLWVVAIGISMHSFAEANDLTSTANLYITNFASVLPDAAPFVIHKFLEGFALVAAALVLDVKGFRQVAVGGAPMLVIAAAGSLSSLLPLTLSPFIAAGVGGWALVTVVLISHLERPSRPKALALVVLGFVVVYAAALLHSTGLVPG